MTTATTTTATKAPRAPKPQVVCWCGCGGLTKSRFVPGHDARFHGLAKKVARDQADGVIALNGLPHDEARERFMECVEHEIPLHEARVKAAAAKAAAKAPVAAPAAPVVADEPEPAAPVEGAYAAQLNARDLGPVISVFADGADCRPNAE